MAGEEFSFCFLLLLARWFLREQEQWGEEKGEKKKEKQRVPPSVLSTFFFLLSSLFLPRRFSLSLLIETAISKSRDSFLFLAATSNNHFL